MITMKIVQKIQKNLIWIVFILMVFSVALGRYYHNFFVNLKAVLPFALFLMLYKPMVYLNIDKAFTKTTEIKTRYFILLTIFYVVIFPLTAFLLMNFILFILPNIDPNLVAGIVILALSPIASSAPAFVGMSNGKVQLTLVGVIYTFFLSLVVMPLGSKLILEHVVKVPIALLLKSLVLYIIIPLIIGQITKYGVIKYKGKQTLENLKTPLEVLVHTGLFIMVIVIFGINGRTIAKEPQIILYGALIMNIYFFLRWGLTYITGKCLKFPLEQNISLTYSSTYNMAISTAIGIATFGPMAAVGTVIGGPFAEMIQMILLVKFFEYIRKKTK
ncbi:MAG: arsenic resistance protein [Candidatus Aenigmarchaeota archaeon]|nr:arsenic resistance protein [Candidatus Aenigmarchaeota archaeon]